MNIKNKKYSVPTAQLGPYGITVGMESALWSTEDKGNKIGRITTEGNISEYNLKTENARPHAIVAGSDNSLLKLSNIIVNLMV
jgi:virginiamycin B lyase